MNLQEIRAALAAGKTVHWSNDAYVVHGAVGSELITCLSNNSSVSLTWRDGVTMDEKDLTQFYVAITDYRLTDLVNELCPWSRNIVIDFTHPEAPEDVSHLGDIDSAIEQWARDFRPHNSMNYTAYTHEDALALARENIKTFTPTEALRLVDEFGYETWPVELGYVEAV